MMTGIWSIQVELEGKWYCADIRAYNKEDVKIQAKIKWPKLTGLKVYVEQVTPNHWKSLKPW